MKSGLVFVVFVVALLGGYFGYRTFFVKPVPEAPEVDWRLLGELDYLTGVAPDVLKEKNGKYVKVPGFMIPLEDDKKSVTQFLLVPSPQACIHVPPPPPNQMVLVDIPDTEIQFGPIWVYGKLIIENKKHIYGESTFHLEADHVEQYR